MKVISYGNGWVMLNEISSEAHAGLMDVWPEGFVGVRAGFPEWTARFHTPRADIDTERLMRVILDQATQRLTREGVAACAAQVLSMSVEELARLTREMAN